MTDQTFEQAMDERLQAALSASNYQISLRTLRAQAKQRLQQATTFSLNGGTFQATPELISFVQTLINLHQEKSVLLDVNKNPIEVELEPFLEKSVELYQEAHNDYLIEYKQIQKSRTTKAVVGA
jgi:hypothetical protein